ncbi:hypothetical protein [Olivibacter domesticus]|uniref:Lipocalin-like domain-containing protein n=1 Tax=Olivibacter domesticus TaxID=407022 RepID=A0A1H7QKP1_OLID1|nr:hypothetical protein [Olivibacter domesticus]SEL48690.1 hypothetical protein SAMN05661044_02637 [Olivibacter domesticus]
MKKSTTLYLLCIFLFSACEKDDTLSTPLQGKWILTETLADPGDGSGEWKTVSEDSVAYIIFNQDGSLQTNLYPKMEHYRVKDSIYLEIGITSQKNPILYRYQIDQNSLLLNPPCIEACGLRFVRTNKDLLNN